MLKRACQNYKYQTQNIQETDAYDKIIIEKLYHYEFNLTRQNRLRRMGIKIYPYLPMALYPKIA